MKYPYYLALITSLAALTGCDQLQSNNSGADNSATASTVAETPAAEGIVIATVNGQPITRSRTGRL